MKTFPVLFVCVVLVTGALEAKMGDTLYVVADNVPLHQHPESASPELLNLERGHKLIELGRNDEWFEVGVYGSEKSGWVAAGFVSIYQEDTLTSPPPSAASPMDTVEATVADLPVAPQSTRALDRSDNLKAAPGQSTETAPGKAVQGPSPNETLGGRPMANPLSGRGAAASTEPAPVALLPQEQKAFQKFHYSFEKWNTKLEDSKEEIYFLKCAYKGNGIVELTATTTWWEKPQAYREGLVRKLHQGWVDCLPVGLSATTKVQTADGVTRLTLQKQGNIRMSPDL